ncbi:LexA family protein [Pseudoxanthomonas winnipegensis]|nr:translesion error-prone DNA polymerase V autoproteolytic subunit [Pseudoxanthomonas winnipegensis]
MRVACGFPSPAEDFQSGPMSLTDLVVRNPTATFYATAEGESMEGFDIHDGDTLVLDRSIDAQDGDICLVVWDGGLLVKQLYARQGTVRLLSGHPDHPPIELGDGEELHVWGVVTWSFRKHFKRKA